MTNLSVHVAFLGNPARIRFWEDSKPNKDSLKPSGTTAKTVETTVYVLLNTLVRGDATYAKPIMNWLTQDQRYGGGFHSTQVHLFNIRLLMLGLSNVIWLSSNFQDSILTLEALTKYSILGSKASLDMMVDIEYKTKGDIGKVTLTQQKPVAKPIEVRHPFLRMLTELLNFIFNCATLMFSSKRWPKMMI